MANALARLAAMSCTSWAPDTQRKPVRTCNGVKLLKPGWAAALSQLAELS
jgi:hypothetical protein